MTKIQTIKIMLRATGFTTLNALVQFLSLKNSGFDFVSDFDIRFSDLFFSTTCFCNKFAFFGTWSKKNFG